MPKQTNHPVVLWVASWYPCKIDRFNGDFIQRSAKALSLQLPVHVFYLMKDEKGVVTKFQKEETERTGNLMETRIYYRPFRTGIKRIDQFISAVTYTRIGRKWLKNFKKNQPQGNPWIVEVGVAMRAGTLALWMKKKWDQPYVVQEHWTGYYRRLMPPDMQRGPLFWSITRKILSQADALLPDSRHLGEWINQDLLKIPFVEIPNTVDTRLFYYNPDQPENGSPMKNRHFRFIHVSTLGYQKNAIGILKCFSDFIEQDPQADVSLEIVGPGFESLFSFVEDKVFLRNKVIFKGPLSYEEVAQCLKNAHAMVLFSRFENLPCVMLEAFCCGLPVIATRVGGIAYHLPETHGILVDSEHDDQLLAAMKRVFTNYQSYNRQFISESSKSRYGMERIGELYVKTYKEFYPHLW